MFEVGWFSKTTPRFDYTWAESMDYAMRMIMLIASYENIFKTSRYIRELVGAGEGDAHLLARFRKWDNYCCSVDVVDRDNCNVTVFDVGSNEAVWRFKMIGYADMDRR